MTEALETLEPSMATEFDVACYIIERMGEVSSMKLQMLLFYCQAMSLAWDGRQLFAADFEAWQNGPMLPSVYEKLKTRFRASAKVLAGDASVLDEDARDTVDQVLKVLGEGTAQTLSRFARSEHPWLHTWNYRDLSVPGYPIIDKSVVREHYSKI